MSQFCICEGNDKHVIASILKKRNCPHPVGVKHKNFFSKELSVSEIPIVFRRILIDSDYANVGVVLDADYESDRVGAIKRYNDLCSIIRNFDDSIVLPETLPEEGLCVKSEVYKKTIGIWVMPNNKDDGYLEHFVETLIPSEQSGKYQMVKDAVDDFNKKTSAIRSVALKKAEIYTYLAWQDNPGRPLGLGISSNYFDAESANANLFYAWLHKTFRFE